MIGALPMMTLLGQLPQVRHVHGGRLAHGQGLGGDRPRRGNIWRQAYSAPMSETTWAHFFTFVIKGSEMNRHTFAFFFACMAAALLLATPAMGQLYNFPVHARSQGPSEGSTWVAASGARGLNYNSGKQNAFGASAGRNMEKVSYAVHTGFVVSDIEELTLAASVAVHLLSDDSMPVQVSLQSGLGWMKEANDRARDILLKRDGLWGLGSVLAAGHRGENAELQHFALRF